MTLDIQIYISVFYIDEIIIARVIFKIIILVRKPPGRDAVQRNTDAVLKKTE